MGLCEGFIPAHAGSTYSTSGSCGELPVHPRACGEHISRVGRDGPVTGSSPRMRGALTDVTEGAYDVRFIPAHAGSTHRGYGAASYNPVHPRACGEHLPEYRAYDFVHGSSPRMRGAPPTSVFPLHPLRFIPAHAGSTQARPGKSVRNSVHPRACGEHPFA